MSMWRVVRLFIASTIGLTGYGIYQIRQMNIKETTQVKSENIQFPSLYYKCAHGGCGSHKRSAIYF